VRMGSRIRVQVLVIWPTASATELNLRPCVTSTLSTAPPGSPSRRDHVREYAAYPVSVVGIDEPIQSEIVRSGDEPETRRVGRREDPSTSASASPASASARGQLGMQLRQTDFGRYRPGMLKRPAI